MSEIKKLLFTTPEYEREEYAYEKNGAVDKALTALNAHLANEPSKYKSQWQTQLKDVMTKIMNREKFSYDFNGDALYQQYKDKFAQQGKMASADVMGQAAAMTGGYGNSYAATVGNQAYQASLQNLNDIVPELYQMALDQYNQQGQDLYNQYGLISDRENIDYGRHRDKVADWMTNRDYLAGRFDSERNFDYGKHSDAENYKYNKYLSDLDKEYKIHADTVSQEQWNKVYDQEQAEIDLANRNIDAEVDEKYNAKVDSLNDYVSSLESELQGYRDKDPTVIELNPTPTDPYASLSSKDDWAQYFVAIKQSEGKMEALREFNNAASSGKLPKTYQTTIRNLITGGRR